MHGTTVKIRRSEVKDQIQPADNKAQCQQLTKTTVAQKVLQNCLLISMPNAKHCSMTSFTERLINRGDPMKI